MPLPHVYFSVSRDKTPLGKMAFKLFKNDCPRTVRNFIGLTTGENENKYCYKGTPFHRIVTDFVAQGGDIEHGNGQGSVSIYGKRFPDENLHLKHNKRGMLSSANNGRNSNGC